MPEASRLTAAAAALSVVSAPLASRPKIPPPGDGDAPPGGGDAPPGGGDATPGCCEDATPGCCEDATPGCCDDATPGCDEASGAAPVALALALAGFALGSAAALERIGRDSSTDFSGVTRMSCDSWPYLASAAASACAQLSPLRRQEQVESNDCSNLSALGMST